MIIAVLVILIICFGAYTHAKQKRKIISSVTSPTRGEYSERDLIYRLVKCGIPANTIFHDVYVPHKGGHTQIDVVVPTNVGVFVFEVKDYSGWIFGDGLREKWTQVLAYGEEKHQFYNPIKQNEGHITALRNALPQFQNIPFYSVVVFYGTSELKRLSNVPYHCRVVYPGQVANLIKNAIQTLEPAPYTDKWEVMRFLKSTMANGTNQEIVDAHLRRAQAASRGKYKSTYKY